MEGVKRTWQGALVKLLVNKMFSAATRMTALIVRGGVAVKVFGLLSVPRRHRCF